MNVLGACVPEREVRSAPTPTCHEFCLQVARTSSTRQSRSHVKNKIAAPGYNMYHYFSTPPTSLPHARGPQVRQAGHSQDGKKAAHVLEDETI